MNGLLWLSANLIDFVITEYAEVGLPSVVDLHSLFLKIVIIQRNAFMATTSMFDGWSY
jgi:hypothetical protein